MPLPAETLRPHARHWILEDGIDYLNHGSFGACPRLVLEAQDELRRRLEREPCRFFVRELEPLLDDARARLADFIGARAEDLVPMPNATAAVNVVLHSLNLAPGDELLTTDHVYGACRNALTHVAERARARVVVARVPFPLSSSEEVVAAVLAAVTPRTKFALLDHVTSATALILPVDQLAPALAERGVELMVDGAHAPGMLDLDLTKLDVPFYAGNCHKWPCAPKGAAFLHVRGDHHEPIRPLAISHGYSGRRKGRGRLHDEFDWAGTADPTPFLCVPQAIDFMGGLLPGGWPALRERNHRLALRGRDILCEALGVARPCPDGMLGSMATVPLPDGPVWPPNAWCMVTDPLQDRLLLEHHIEVPVSPWPRSPRRVIRVSAQAYNDEAQYLRLAEVLPGLLEH